MDRNLHPKGPILTHTSRDTSIIIKMWICHNKCEIRSEYGLNNFYVCAHTYVYTYIWTFGLVEMMPVAQGK